MFFLCEVFDVLQTLVEVLLFLVEEAETLQLPSPGLHVLLLDNDTLLRNLVDALRGIQFHVEPLVVCEVVDELLTVVLSIDRNVRVQVLSIAVVVFDDRLETDHLAPLLDLTGREFVDETIRISESYTVDGDLVVLTVSVFLTSLRHDAAIVVDTAATLHDVLTVRQVTDNLSVDGHTLGQERLDDLERFTPYITTLTIEARVYLAQGDVCILDDGTACVDVVILDRLLTGQPLRKFLLPGQRVLAEYVGVDSGRTIPLGRDVDEVVRGDSGRLLPDDGSRVVETELVVNYTVELLQSLLTLLVLLVTTLSGSLLTLLVDDVLLANPELLTLVLYLVELRTDRAVTLIESDGGGGDDEINQGLERQQEALGGLTLQLDSLDTTVVLEHASLLRILVEVLMLIEVSESQKLRVDAGHGREVNELARFLVDAHDDVESIHVSDLQPRYLGVDVLGESVYLYNLRQVVLI